MIWAAYFILALESLVIALSLWIMWVMISEASRAPASTVAGASAGSQRRRLVSSKDEDFPALFILEEVDDRGYVSSRKLHMGCEAALCRTPSGARNVVLRSLRLLPLSSVDIASPPS
jgi:hypothetical protein